VYLGGGGGDREKYKLSVPWDSYGLMNAFLGSEIGEIGLISYVRK
jgi:hypothetical protein